LRRSAPLAVAVEGLNRSEVRRVFAEAKVFIDFGEHPGKDRMPREAAALGCCVLTNRRGSAANGVDVPIPDEFKINDRKPARRFEWRAATKIWDLIEDYERQAPRFDAYREMIAGEPAQFTEDVRALFPVKVPV
jgi:hypothetical protein